MIVNVGHNQIEVKSVSNFQISSIYYYYKNGKSSLYLLAFIAQFLSFVNFSHYFSILFWLVLSQLIYFLHIFTDFIDWLWKLCLDNLYPGACFQRLKMCLDLALNLLDATIHSPSEIHKKKGKVPGEFYSHKNLFNFVNPPSTPSYLLQHGDLL